MMRKQIIYPKFIMRLLSRVVDTAIILKILVVIKLMTCLVNPEALNSAITESIFNTVLRALYFIGS